MAVCKDCQYCEVSPLTADLKREYVCKRYPPAAQLIPTANGVMAVTAKLVVDPGNWCGEYRATKPKINIV